ncbi:two-component system QseEF-associated lipoprotein QseG [Mangrovibacter yixingensis]|uniref:two-component system QseEF-associated lipoprotein QseG n=1 Tax=Mangrovibacter yixingensis TaxID=1529639 RepID=UPI001CFE088B|nr:two-component system QseEF-associated lipoprotein QseG [Mangrovibacter yixingensis]
MPNPFSTCSAVARRFSLRAMLYRVLSGGLFLVLAGCQSGSETTSLSGTFKAPPVPQTELTDYLAMRCSDLLQMRTRETSATENPLYWAAFISCARQTEPNTARVIASRWAESGWYDTLRSAIMLSRSLPENTVRQRYLNQVFLVHKEIPASVVPLFNMWWDNEQLALKLATQQNQYAQLKNSTDQELETLRQQQQLLHQQLETTTRKLENLTDIERQLSTRKAGGVYTPDTGAGHSGTSHSSGSASGQSGSDGEETP